MIRALIFAFALLGAMIPTRPTAAQFFAGFFPASGSGRDVFLTDAVMTGSGSTQTNVPLTLGVPLAMGTLDATHSIKVVDQTTSTTFLCQEDARASDLVPSVRFTDLTCINPSLTSATDSLKLYATAGAPAAGTDITIADIVATTYDEPVSVTNINGVSGTWTASPLTALNSGHSTWVNTTTAAVLGKFRTGGGLATEYILFVPLVKSGTADAQLHAIFDVVCFKAARAAVGGGNPITSCRTDTIMENAYVQEVSPVDDYYGITIGTAGADLNLPNSTPAVALTLGSVGPAGTVSVVAGSALFTANSLGQTIANGTGVAVINGETDSTHATANIYKAFGSTSVGSGTYTLYGTNHPWAARYVTRGWWVPSGSAPAYTANLGDAWNNSTFVGGPFAYFASTKLIMNYAVTPTTCGATSLFNLNAMGTNPMSYTGGGSQFGAGGNSGDLGLFLETSGEAPAIGVSPDWDVCGLIRYDSNALARILGNSQRWMSFPIGWRDQNTGLTVSPCNAGAPPNCVGTTNWEVNGGGSGTAIVYPSNGITAWSADNGAHDPNDFYIAYLLTGDFPYLESQQFSALYAWTSNDSGLSGTGIQKTVYTNLGNFSGGGGQNGLQERGRTWQLQKIIDATLLTPDSSPSVLGQSKTILQDWLADEWIATHGAVTLFVNDVTHYVTPGPRWTFNNNNSFSMFESGYAVFALFHEFEQGMLDTNGQSYLSWYAENEASAVNDTADLVPQYTAPAQYMAIQDVSSSCPGTYQASWANVYKATAAFSYPGSFSKAPARYPNTTLLLSGTSGTAVTATFGGGGYFATTSFYPGMWIVAGTGAARIVSVTNSNTLVVDTTATHTYYVTSCVAEPGAAFNTTSYAAGGFYVPMAAPGDPVGTEFAAYVASPGDDYLEIVQADTSLMSKYGLSGGATACMTSWGYTNSGAGCGVQPMSLQQSVKWVIR